MEERRRRPGATRVARGWVLFAFLAGFVLVVAGPFAPHGGSTQAADSGTIDVRESAIATSTAPPSARGATATATLSVLSAAPAAGTTTSTGSFHPTMAAKRLPSPVLDAFRAVPHVHVLAEAKQESTPVYDNPPPNRVKLTLRRGDTLNKRIVFAVLDTVSDGMGKRWLKVILPHPPNASIGWVPEDQVFVKETTTEIRIDLSRHRLCLYEKSTLVKSYPAGVGLPGMRTPTGAFFLTSKIQPWDPGGPYGALAMGVSAYSETLTDWPGGGQIGIHGTNAPSSVGVDASHGCVRMHNQDVIELGNRVDLGTAVLIQQ